MPTQNFFEIKLNDEAGEFGNQIDKEFIAGTFWWVEWTPVLFECWRFSSFAQ